MTLHPYISSVQYLWRNIASCKKFNIKHSKLTSNMMQDIHASTGAAQKRPCTPRVMLGWKWFNSSLTEAILRQKKPDHVSILRKSIRFWAKKQRFHFKFQSYIFKKIIYSISVYDFYWETHVVVNRHSENDNKLNAINACNRTAITWWVCKYSIDCMALSINPK